MEDNNAKVAKSTLWYTISNILLRGVSVFTAPIFTRLLSTADYVIASNFTSWASIVLCFTGLSLSTAVLRGKLEFEEKYKEYLSAVQGLGLIWALLCGTIIFYTLDFWSDIMKLDKVCILVMLIYLIVYPSLTYAQIDFRFDYKYKENVAISIINTIGTVVCSIALILFWTNQRYLGRIVGTVIPTIIMGTYFAVKIFKQGRKIFDVAYWSYALKISLPMIPHSVAMIILGQIDRVMIIQYCGESEAGIYSFGYSYAILISVITNAINDAVQPQMYEMLKVKEEKKVALLSYKLILMGVMISTFLIGVGPEALKILGTADYFDARWVIFPVVVGTLMQYIYQFFGVIEIYCKKTIYMAIGSCGAAIANYVLNMMFIPKWGYVAAAYTTLISYMLLMLFHFFMARVAYKSKVYSFIPIVAITILTIIVGYLINYLYRFHWLIRYGVLIILGLGMTYCLKNEIKLIINYMLSKVRKQL